MNEQINGTNATGRFGEENESEKRLGYIYIYVPVCVETRNGTADVTAQTSVKKKRTSDTFIVRTFYRRGP